MNTNLLQQLHDQIHDAYPKWDELRITDEMLRISNCEGCKNRDKLSLINRLQQLIVDTIYQLIK